jgi:hypothetical protein
MLFYQLPSSLLVVSPMVLKLLNKISNLQVLNTLAFYHVLKPKVVILLLAIAVLICGLCRQGVFCFLPTTYTMVDAVLKMTFNY